MGMTPKEMKRRAIELMAVQRFHCSQALAAVGQEKLEKRGDDVIRAMGAFGGGLGGNGEVCGALVGAMAVLGLCYSRAHQHEKENPKMCAAAQELLRRFRDEAVDQEGTIYCRDIADVDWTDRAQAREFYSGDKVKRCIRIVGHTAFILGELLERDP